MESIRRLETAPAGRFKEHATSRHGAIADVLLSVTTQLLFGRSVGSPAGDRHRARCPSSRSQSSHLAVRLVGKAPSRCRSASTSSQGFWSIGGAAEGRDLFWWDEQLDASRGSGVSTDQPALSQHDDHAVSGGGRDLEVRLEVGLRWGPAVHLGVGVDKRQVLPLRLREGCGHRLRVGRAL